MKKAGKLMKKIGRAVSKDGDAKEDIYTTSGHQDGETPPVVTTNAVYEHLVQQRAPTTTGEADCTPKDIERHERREQIYQNVPPPIIPRKQRSSPDDGEGIYMQMNRGLNHKKTIIGDKKRSTPLTSFAKGQYASVVAIDFGTTASGYAYWHTEDSETEIKLNDNWKATTGSFYKCPTCVAVRDGKFFAFGFHALQAYMEENDQDQEQQEENRITLFNEFKMQLASQETIGRSTVIKTDFKVQGAKEITALDVFKMALNFMQQSFLTFMKDSGRELSANNVLWVITVPAIWSDEQKYFMREAAFMANMIESTTSPNLIIALEPECAALYCRKQNRFDGEYHTGTVLLPGTEYMVVDAGGGTTDISIHKVTSENKSEEIFRPSGIAVGGTNITTAFEKFMEEILGAEFVTECKKNVPGIWLELLLDFNLKKSDIDANFCKDLNIGMKYGLTSKFEEVTGETIKAHIKSLGTTDVDFSKTGKLIIKKEKVAELFLPTVNRIIEHLQRLFTSPKLANVTTIYLVGGFGTCAALKSQLKAVFGLNKKVLIPEEPSVAVLRGAVMFGQNPNFVTMRIARKTYSLLVARDYDKNTDSVDRMERVPDGTLYVESLVPIIKVGDQVALNMTKTIETETMVAHQSVVKVEIFVSDEREVENPKDPRVKKLGDINIWMQSSDQVKERDVLVGITFGGTELKVFGKTKTRTVEATLKLLMD